MRWLLWRQLRLAFAALAVVEVILCVNAWQASQAATALYRCIHSPSLRTIPSGCHQFDAAFSLPVHNFPGNVVVTTIYGLVVGSVMALNLIVVEFDRSTIRLSWTQSQTRAVWLRDAWAGGVLAIMALTVPLSLVLAQWKSDTRVSFAGLAASGGSVVLLGIFSFVLTSFIGTRIRKSGWSLVVSFVLLAAACFGMQWIHSAAVKPHVKWTASESNWAGISPPSGSWLLREGIVQNERGNVPSARSMHHALVAFYACGGQTQVPPPACWTSLDLANVSVFVPGSELPTLLVEEYLFFGAVISLFAAATVRRVRQIDV